MSASLMVNMLPIPNMSLVLPDGLTFHEEDLQNVMRHRGSCRFCCDCQDQLVLVYFTPLQLAMSPTKQHLRHMRNPLLLWNT